MFIHLDPRRPDVAVPKWFMGQPQLVLQVGLNMAIPIPDLKVDDQGITCTLSFNRAPFWCKIPWSAVYALVGEDGRGGVWAEDVPPEIQLQRQGSSPQKSQPSKKPRPKLAAVTSSDRAPARDEEEAKPAPSPAPSKPAAEVERPKGPRAVPSLAAAPEPSDEAPEQKPEGAGSEAPSASPSSPAGGKKKREIPPYLRVIK